MDVVIASNNKHKIEEIKAILGGHFGRLYSLKEIGAEIEIDETGSTFRENAYLKAEAVSRLTGLPALADDSGLVVDALGGAPGVYSARFSGPRATDAENNALLLKKMENAQNRAARFVSVVALVFPDGEKIDAEGVAEGRVLAKESGAAGFGYDPLFYAEELKKTYAEATAEEKNRASHRGKALAALEKKLSDFHPESIDKFRK